MSDRLTPATVARMERRWELQREAVRLLDLIAAEFASDPTSVQCFDLRVVDQAIAVSKELRAIGDFR